MLKKVFFLCVFLQVSLLSVAGLAQLDAEKTWQSDNGEFSVVLASELNPIVINQIHSWTLQLTNAEGAPIADAEITVAGGMPEHNHGLATSPSVTAQGNGSYLLQGLRFHMLGYWELELTINHADLTDKVLITLDL